MATDWKLLGPPGGGESKHSRANGLLQERWHQAVDQMRSELDSSDARRLGAFQDPSLMMDQLEQEFTAAEGAAFRRWRPILTTIEKASMLLAAALMSAQPTETKILWGLLHLILTTAVEGRDLLEDLGRRHERIKLAMDRIIGDLGVQDEVQRPVEDPEIGNSLLEAFKSLIRFWVKAVRILQSGHSRIWMARFPDQIRGVYDDALLKLKNASDLIRDTMQAQSKFDPVPYPAPLPSQNAEISESVILVPHPANPDFTGRVSLLQELEESLRPPKDGLHVQRRTLLHGMKGIGKTQIALHFARAAFAAKIFSHVFWVPCETERLIQQTFSEIATELGLTREGLSTDVSANVQAVHKWLRQTGSSWLIIFDNVEPSSNLQQYWPSDRGSILITSYNEHVGAGYKPRKLEVHPLSNSDSRELFVALLDQKPDVDDEEAIQYLLSEMMGYTLGLAQLAGLMNEQHQSLKEFRAEYAEYPEQLNESAVELPAGYKHCIASVWTMSFNIVESNPMQYQLLGMLSFIYPDEIPISVFTPIRDTASDLPPELASFGTASRIKLSREAIIPLMSLALINRHDKLLSMHRLTQSAFLTRSDDRTAQQWFDNVTSLLYHAFPHSSNGLAPDGDWTACTPLISHVDHLLTCWDHLRTRGRQLRGNDHLSLLLQAATWHLYETSDSYLALRWLDTFYKANPFERTIVFAQLKHTEGCCYVEVNELSKGKVALETCLGLRKDLLGPEHPATARTMNLLGVIQTATGDPETALRTMRVVESIRSKANDEILLAVTWETTGIAHFKAGNLSSALERLMQADTVFGKATDRNSLLDLRKGHNDLALGNVLRAMNKLDDALATWKYAANLVGKESPTHMLKAGLMYKTAQILLDKADWTSAKPILEEALEIATFRLSEGDIARISWTLARCLRMELGSLDQTSSLRKNLDDSLEQRALALDGVAYGLRKKLRVQFGLDVIESNLRQASIEEKNTEERFVKIQLKDDGSDSSSGKERGRTTKQQELAAKYEELNSFDNLVGPFFR